MCFHIRWLSIMELVWWKVSYSSSISLTHILSHWELITLYIFVCPLTSLMTDLRG